MIRPSIRMSVFSYSQICTRVFCDAEASTGRTSGVWRRQGARRCRGCSYGRRRAAHVLQKPEDQVLRTRRTGRQARLSCGLCSVGSKLRRALGEGAGAECWQLTIGCVMIFWTLDAMALRDEA